MVGAGVDCICRSDCGRYAVVMTEVVVQIPESTPEALGLDPRQLGDHLLLAAAVQWYESGRLSSGAAAELAGLPKPVFLQRLQEFGVATFRQSRDELREEIANA